MGDQSCAKNIWLSAAGYATQFPLAVPNPVDSILEGMRHQRNTNPALTLFCFRRNLRRQANFDNGRCARNQALFRDSQLRHEVERGFAPAFWFKTILHD
jgi:hypothetical protein